MATLTSTACQTFSNTGFFLSPPKYLEEGMVVRSAVYTFGANQSAGDIIQMVPVPKGCQIADVKVQVDAKAAGGDFVLNGVGDGNNTARFISTSASGSAVAAITSGLGYSYSADDTIDIKIGTVTSATAGGSVRLTVMYSMDQSTDGAS